MYSKNSKVIYVDKTKYPSVHQQLGLLSLLCFRKSNLVVTRYDVPCQTDLMYETISIG